MCSQSHHVTRTLSSYSEVNFICAGDLHYAIFVVEVGMESDQWELIISGTQISVVYHLLALALAKNHF